MQTAYHTLVWNLDSGDLQPSLIDYPRGYNHVITVQTVKSSADIQPSDLKIELAGEFPVVSGNKILTTGAASWDGDTDRSTLSVNNTGAPMNGYGQRSLAAKLTCTHSATTYTRNFHIGFLQTPAPASISGGVPPGLPPAFNQWLNDNWPISYLGLTNKPTDIPAFSVGETVGAQFVTIAQMTAFDATTLTNNVIVNASGYAGAVDGGGGNFHWRTSGSPPAEDGATIFHDDAATGYFQRT